MRTTGSGIIATIALLLMLSSPVRAQGGAAASVAFAPVAEIPIPLQSISGRWSSLHPYNRRSCFYSYVTGRVVSARLISVKEMDCGQGPETSNVLVNVELSNPADAVQMVPGRRVTVKAHFKVAQEPRSSWQAAIYIIAEKAELTAGDPRGAPQPAFMSYMLCQPPELDALATRIGSEVCVQSTLLPNLATAAAALEAAARAPAKLGPDDAVSGDPDAISCRLDPGLSDRQLQAIACARNNYWAWYKAEWRIPFTPTLAPP
jgi:hypothetical protein